MGHPRVRRTVVRLLPAAVGLALLTLWRPDGVRSLAGSPRALSLIGSSVLLSLLLRRLLPRVLPAGIPRWLPGALAKVPVIAVSAVLLLPGARATRVVEAAPAELLAATVVAPASSAPASSAPASSAPASSAPASSAPASSAPASSPPVRRAPASSEPASSEPASSEPASSAPPVRRTPASSPQVRRPTAPPTPPAPAPASAAGPIRSALAGIGHRAAGQVVLLRRGDGTALLRFEGLDVEPGPDYDVYLVPGQGRRNPDGGTKLADLRATSGDQNYAVPPGLARGPVTALVWCTRYAVPVAAASFPAG